MRRLRWLCLLLAIGFGMFTAYRWPEIKGFIASGKNAQAKSAEQSQPKSSSAPSVSPQHSAVRSVQSALAATGSRAARGMRTRRKEIPAGEDRTPPGAIRVAGRFVHPTRILVKPRHVAESINALAKDKTGYAVAQVYRSGWLLVDRAARPQGFSDEQLASELQKKMRELERTGLFATVDYDGILLTQAEPDDAAYVDGRLWGLRNTGQEHGLPGADINVAPAWGITTGSREVIVAVIDTGISLTHQDLREQLWTNAGEIPNNGVDDDGNGYIDDVHGANFLPPMNSPSAGDPSDDHGHGTHCAGTIGAAANNGYDHVGVAWNVQLMGCKFLTANGSGFDSDAIEAIDYAVANGASILSCSWGGFGFSAALYDAFAAASGAGVLTVAAAGNNRLDLDVLTFSPASFDLDSLISVAAIDRRDELAWFSNFGVNNCDVGAPGVDILSCDAFDDRGYRILSGTSMACPHVAGVAALVRARYPDIPLDEWRQRIVSTATPTPALAGRVSSGGRVNAFNALSAQEDSVLEVDVRFAHVSVVQTGGGSFTGLQAGASNSVILTVHDLQAVTNAMARVRIGSGEWLPLRNDGILPDRRAADAVYVTSFVTPDQTNAIEVAWEAVAPGKAAAQGTVVVLPVRAPTNDDFDQRQLLMGTNVTIAGTVIGATREFAEPAHNFFVQGGSVWYGWVAPRDGYIIYNTPSQAGMVGAFFYTGISVSGLMPVQNVYQDWQRAIPASYLPVRRGTVYSIAMEELLGRATDFQFQLSFYEGDTPAVVPYFSVQPDSRVIEAGSEIFFGCATVSTVPVKYQWHFNGAPLANRTLRTLQLPGANNSQAGSYFVTASNVFGMATSSVATLTVVPTTVASGLYDDFEPNFDGPQWSELREGVRVNDYGGSVSGSNSLWFDPRLAQPLTTRPLDTSKGGVIRFWLHTGNYQNPNWQGPSTPYAAMGFNFIAPGRGMVSITNLLALDYRSWRQVEVAIPPEAQLPNARFSWHVGDDDTYVGHWAIDDVEVVTYENAAPPVITEDLDDIEALVGEYWAIKFGVEGGGPWTFRWYRNGVFLPLNFPGSKFYGIGTLSESGSYFVTASNALDVVTSRVAQVTVRPEPTLADALDLTNLTVSVESTGYGSVRWQTITTNTHDGIDALYLRHYDDDDNHAPALVANVQGPGEISFWWQSGVEPGFSTRFSFFVDGEERAFISNVAQWRLVRIDLTEGAHVLRWLPAGDYVPFSAARARVWLDELRFTPAPPQPPYIIELRGIPEAGNVVAEGTPLIFEVRALGNDLTFAWRKNGTSLPEGTQARYTISSAAVADTGTYSVLVSNVLGVVESELFDVTVVGLSQHALDLASALDGPGFTWTTSPEKPWIVSDGKSHDGTDAASSPKMNPDETSWLETSVEGPGYVGFWWKSSTEAGFDQFVLYDNGRPLRFIDGETDWQFERVALASGTHALRWVYDKDDIGTGGLDRVWLDEVAFSFEPLPNISLGEALNQSSWEWSTDGIHPWIVDTNVHHDGVAAVSSGMLPRGTSNFIQATVPGPATLRFWWRFGATFGADTLSLAVDGAPAASARGDNDWQPVAIQISPGMHQLRWSFSYFRGYLAGDAQAWLDQVELIPDQTRFNPAALRVDAGGRAHLLLLGPPGRLAVTERSTNLRDWTAIATNFLNSDGNLVLNLEPALLPAVFFRIGTSQ